MARYLERSLDSREAYPSTNSARILRNLKGGDAMTLLCRWCGALYTRDDQTSLSINGI